MSINKDYGIGFVNQRLHDGVNLMAYAKAVRSCGGETHIIAHKLGKKWGPHVRTMCDDLTVIEMDSINGDYSEVYVTCDKCIKEYNVSLELRHEKDRMKNYKRVLKEEANGKFSRN